MDHNQNKNLESSQSQRGPKDISGSEYPLFTVDAFDDGLAIGQHVTTTSHGVVLDDFLLRLPSESQIVRLKSRYMLDRKKPFQELEKQLIRLSRKGILRKTVIILGVNNDPFHPFEGRFDASMKFLSLFEKYTPGMLCIQTRSPLLVLALPVLKRLGEHCLISYALETTHEESARRYTPFLPRVDERLKAIKSLSRFGIPLRLSISPLLPYGHWIKDANTVAEKLLEYSSNISIRGLSDGTEQRERQLSALPLVQKLAQDRKFHWLRADATLPLRAAIEKLAPSALNAPSWAHLKDPQLGIFAA
jgi:hypothetical protein